MLLTQTMHNFETPRHKVPRRAVSVVFAAVLCAMIGLWVTPAQAEPVHAESAQDEETANKTFVEGTHYERLPVSVATGDDGTVEVVEMFSYACVHCYNFDPVVEAWHARQDDGVKFVRIPAIFSNDWELLAQAFYTAETLGVTDAVHMPMFQGIHIAQQDLRQTSLLKPLFKTHADISEEDFDTAYNSFSVRSRVQQAKAKGRAYRITGVPTMIVNGKYRVDGRMAGSNTNMLEVVDYLVGLEQQPSADGN